jgi:hypothetical protein
MKEVSSLLNVNGYYAFIVPDSRYCFDHFLSPSNLSLVVRAWIEERRKPDVWNVIEHRALTCHNDPILHWQNQSGSAFSNLNERWLAAEEEFKDANGNYIDVHCWQFTPNSLEIILIGLRELGLIDFEIHELWETPQNDLEFCVILKKADRKGITAY